MSEFEDWIGKSQTVTDYLEPARSNALDVTLGGINTAVLISSSLTMALAVYGAQTGKRTMLITCLLATMALGFVSAMTS